MATDKYDLHTIDYSVQGWDSILATDMEKLDDIIHTRVEAIAGETVAQYDAVYLESDGKYDKALADGSQQPAVGLALESASLDDEFRVQRIGPITKAGWSWATKGVKVYLDGTTPGALTDVKPGSNVQMMGFVLSATSIFIWIDPMEGGGGGGGDFSDGGEAGGADRTLGNTDNYDLGFKTNDVIRVFIQKDGKMGLGILVPTAPLHISTTVKPGLIISSGSEAPQMRFVDEADNDYFHWQFFRSSDKIDMESNTVQPIMSWTKAGEVGIGRTPSANMPGLVIEQGLLTLKERTTPTADANYGKVYTKADSKLYFQDGAGVEHEISLV